MWRDTGIIDFIVCALFHVVFWELLWFLSDFFPFWAKMIPKTHIGPYLPFQTTKPHGRWTILDVLITGQFYDQVLRLLLAFLHWEWENSPENMIGKLTSFWQPSTWEMDIFDAFPMAELHIICTDSVWQLLSFFLYAFLTFKAKMITK